jgi:hypothetical protein
MTKTIGILSSLEAFIKWSEDRQARKISRSESSGDGWKAVRIRSGHDFCAKTIDELILLEDFKSVPLWLLVVETAVNSPNVLSVVDKSGDWLTLHQAYHDRIGRTLSREEAGLWQGVLRMAYQAAHKLGLR